MAKTLMMLSFTTGIICLLFISVINIETLRSEENVNNDIVTTHTGLSLETATEYDISKYV